MLSCFKCKTGKYAELLAQFEQQYVLICTINSELKNDIFIELHCLIAFMF